MTSPDPIRVKDFRLLPMIPKEIYLEIFSYFDPVHLNRWQCMDQATKRTLFNISRICRFFSAAVLPWAFKTLRFDSERDPGGTNAALGARSHLGFCRAIIEGDKKARAYAGYVKTCVFNRWFDHRINGALNQLEWTFETILAVYFRAIRFMSNLEELAFRHTPITARILKTIVSLPQLSSLKLRDCVVSTDVRDKDLRKFARLELKHLDVTFLIGENTDYFPSTLLLGRTLLIANINVASAQEFRTNHPHLAGQVGNSRTSPARVLDISDGPIPYSTMPNLTTIILHTEFYHGIHLPKGAWPALKSVDVPFSLCRYLIPGRPVESIKTYGGYLPPVNDHPNGAPGAEVLWSSTRPVTTLDIPIGFFKKIQLWKHFPDLQVLSLHGSYKVQPEPVDDLDEFDSDEDNDIVTMEEAMAHISETISAALRTWPHYPITLHTLNFDLRPEMKYNWDLDEQLAWILLVVAPLIPSLRCCRFFDNLQWVLSEMEGSWLPQRVARATTKENRRLLEPDFLAPGCGSFALRRREFVAMHDHEDDEW